MSSQAEFTRKSFLSVYADFQEAYRLKEYHGKWYSEDLWSDIIHQNIEIKTALSFNGKDPRTAISKYKHLSMQSKNYWIPTNGEYIH